MSRAHQIARHLLYAKTRGESTVDERIKLSKTGVFLLVLTALFLLSVGTVYLLTPRTVQGDYTVEAQAPVEKTDADKVNINTADADELETLPGIGPVLARRIIDWRTANGPFTCPEDLLQVSGIGQTTLDGLRDRIITEETQE